MTQALYAIPDIHGQSAALDRALGLVEADGGPEAEIVFLGDLVDRGPDSRGVITRLMEGIRAGRPWRVLCGNHDRMFVNFLRRAQIDDANISSGLPWLHPRLGGAETLASYGVDVAGTPLEQIAAAARAAVPQAHLDWLAGLPVYFERGDLLFVHAGIRPGRPLAEQEEDDLLWIRDPFLDHRDPHPWLVVHGHTAIPHPRHHGNRVNLDGGAGFGRPLVPAVFEDGRVWTLDEAGRAPLLP